MLILSVEAPRWEVEEVPYGRVFRWHPAAVAILCDCGEKCMITPHHEACAGCGADYSAVMERRIEVFASTSTAEEAHPWRDLEPVPEALPY